MTKLLTADQFLDALTQSNLLDADRVRQFVEAEGSDHTAPTLAERMTAAGLITRLQAHNLLAGRTQGYFVGPYKLLDKLGNGATGQVYLAEHVRMRRRVALKVLQAEKARSPEAVKRFEREAKAAAAIRHRNIVHAYDFSRDEHMHYLVMEYIEGRNVLQILTEDGRLGPREAARLMRQAANGLQFAHQSGVVHRDVKPSNLMVSADGRLTLLDLGLARYDGDDENLTRGGAVLGVAAFIAPEQVADSHSVDGRADLYGLGASFWLATTGKKPPVYGKFEPPPPRTPFETAEYEQLLAIIQKCMALKPSDRYQSAADLSTALTPLAGDIQIIHTPPPVGARVPGRSSTSTPKLEGTRSASRSSGSHSVLDDADENDDCILSAPVPVKQSARPTVVNPSKPAVNPPKSVAAFIPPPPLKDVPRPAPEPAKPLPSPAAEPDPFRFGSSRELHAHRPTAKPHSAVEEPIPLVKRWWVWVAVLGGSAVVGVLAAVLAAKFGR